MGWMAVKMEGRAMPRPSTDTSIGIAIAIACPECPKCGTQMMLARVMPESPGHEQRTFECPMCEHSESVLVKFA
jgi:predicted RNA-binding Zn-ribbon protein involved in translation (DUF1610 family)